MEKLDVLRKCDMFSKLDDMQLAEVAKMCSSEVFEPGAIIAKQNTREAKLYVIEEGLVAIILETGPLSQRQVQGASNYEVVGWSSMLEPHIATATVKAIEKTKVLTFNGEDIVNLCATNCRVGCNIYQGVSRVVADRLHAAFMQCLGVTAQD